MIYYVQNAYLDTEKRERLMIFFKRNHKNVLIPQENKIAVDIDHTNKKIKGWLQYKFKERKFVVTNKMDSKLFLKRFPNLTEEYGIISYYFVNGILKKILYGEKDLRKFALIDHGNFVFQFFKSAEYYKFALLNKVIIEDSKMLNEDTFKEDEEENYEYKEEGVY